MGHPPLWPELLLIIIAGLLFVILPNLGTDDPPVDAERKWNDLPEWQRKSRG